jgi:hypothetical protein
MGPLDADTVRASLLYLVVIALSLPLWVVLLFPGRYEEYLLSPALVVLIVFGWLAVALGFVIGNYLGV